MALYPVRPLYSASATATNGSDIITVTGNVNCAFIASGAIVSLGTRQLVDAIAGTAPDGSGNSTIKLRRPWADPTTTGPLLAFMSWEGLADAVARLSQIIAASEGAVEGAFSNMGDWSAASGDFPPSPGEGLGSQMYRVSVAGTMGGRAYRVGEVIYYDQFTSQWRSMLGLATDFSTGLLASANAAAWRDELGLVPTASATDTTPGRIWRNSDLVKTVTNTDTTAGRMLKVGDFGLGDVIALPGGDNLNNLSLVSATFYASSPINGPSASNGWVEQKVITSDFIRQIFHAVDLRDTFVRSKIGGSWTGWTSNYHNANIVGSISQSSGIPTGAIIQRGTNANGEFIRFADGTQICWRSLDIQDHPINSDAVASGLWPAEFAGGLRSIWSTSQQLGAGSLAMLGLLLYNGVADTSTTTLARLSTYSYRTAISEPIRLSIIGIGRWF